MLHAIRLNVKWLQSALIFGHHNVKTRPPGGRANKRFWTKANLSAYLRSYSCTGRLIDSIYLSAKNGDSDPPFATAWSDPLIFFNVTMHRCICYSLDMSKVTLIWYPNGWVVMKYW